MIVTHAQLLHPKSNSFIGNGIKYIMFPLHLLHLCIFGTGSPAAETPKPAELQDIKTTKKDDPRETPEKEERKKKDAQPTKLTDADDENSKDRDEKIPKEKRREKSLDRSKSPCAKSSPRKPRLRKSSQPKDDSENKACRNSLRDTTRQKLINDDCDSIDEMMTAAEDSDTSSDHWSSANSTMIMNMSVEYENALEKCPSFVRGEPMDVSVEEHIEKTLSSTRFLRDYRSSDLFRGHSKNISTRGLPDGQDAPVQHSIDEEIAKIFQKQCTSSEDESPARQIGSPKRYSGKENKLPNRTEHKEPSAHSRVKKERSYNNSSERKTKTPTEFAVSKRRKTSQEDDANQRKTDRQTQEGVIEKRRATREDTPSKRRSRSSGTLIKVKETKRKEVKYKEIATQTDSAVSDNDVEMTPVEMKLSDRWSSNRSNRRFYSTFSQTVRADQDQNYIADNEDSSDTSVKFVRQRISSDSTSSSLTDLGFDEHVYNTADAEVRLKGQQENGLPDIVAAHRVPIARAPPGFPELPLNPPLTPYAYEAANCMLPQSTTPSRKFLECSLPHVCGVPPAPTPMRHLYYNYPEFMDLPENAATSRILQSILRNNYYR